MLKIVAPSKKAQPTDDTGTKYAILPWISWPVAMSNTKAIMFDTFEEESMIKLIETCCQSQRPVRTR